MNVEKTTALLSAGAAPPPALVLTTMLDLFNWYCMNLCGRVLLDPRGHLVSFEETDFVHLIKLKNKYGEEPRNARMTIDHIRSGRVTLVAGRFEIRRAQELSWARSIIESPTLIVPNWQVMGRANPGDAYIKSFKTNLGTHYRVLICGHSGMKRRVVTIFARERFSDREISPTLWP